MPNLGLTAPLLFNQNMSFFKKTLLKKGSKFFENLIYGILTLLKVKLLKGRFWLDGIKSNWF